MALTVHKAVIAGRSPVGRRVATEVGLPTVPAFCKTPGGHAADSH